MQKTANGISFSLAKRPPNQLSFNLPKKPTEEVEKLPAEKIHIQDRHIQGKKNKKLWRNPRHVHPSDHQGEHPSDHTRDRKIKASHAGGEKPKEGSRSLYLHHLSLESVEEGLRNKTFFEGSLRINKRNRLDSTCLS